MKQFKSHALIILFYEICGWCYASRQLPRKIDIWVEDEGKGSFVANVYHYPDKTPIKELTNELENTLKGPEKDQKDKEYAEADTQTFAQKIRKKNKDELENERIQIQKRFNNSYPSIRGDEDSNDFHERNSCQCME